MEEGPMKKSCLFFVIFSFLVLSLAGVSYGWQGRMAGMGDPYGLVQDESDFLFHPAKIANGKGINFYGGYHFNYTGVTDWNYNLDQFNPAGTLTGFYHYDASGHEYKHDGLMGAAFPLGPGRMGLFFEYAGKRGDYEGNEDILGTINFADYDLKSNLNNFALRLLYGLPFGGFKLGGEFQLAYRKEENRNDMPNFLNYILGTGNPARNLTPFQLPYDSSKYWETLLKGSLEGKVGPVDVEFTLRGGFIFSGNNSFEITQGNIFIEDSSGNVGGWRIGGDVWARYPLGNGLSLPFLVRVDYQEKTRDGEGLRTDLPQFYYPYDSKEQNLHLEAGGGVNKDFGKGTRIAAGIYYNYLHGKYDITLKETTDGLNGQIWNHSEYPASTEHQFMLRLAGEYEISPTVTLRMGIVPFFGWVKENFKFIYGNISYTDDITLDGSHWGIVASLGGTMKFQRFILEPFINAGYQKLNLKGDGEHTLASFAITNLWEMDKLRKEWSIGGGFSIKFN
jgi:hypothetical protein